MNKSLMRIVNCIMSSKDKQTKKQTHKQIIKNKLTYKNKQMKTAKMNKSPMRTVSCTMSSKDEQTHQKNNQK